MGVGLSRILPGALQTGLAGAKHPMAFVELPVFPRREKAFKLQLYDRTSALVAELNVPNPMYRDYARWQSEALPVTRCLGERSVSHRPPLTGFS